MQRFFPLLTGQFREKQLPFLMKALHEPIKMGKEKVKIIVIELKTFFW